MTIERPNAALELRAPLERAAKTLGVDLSPAQAEQLLTYLQLLQRWNGVHNLSGAHDADRLLREHIIDCLAIVPPLTRHAAGRPLRVLDAGTGAGLPALVIAVLLPQWQVTAVDAVGKKVAFLRQAVGEMGLTNAQPIHARLEDLPRASRFDLICSRAFASLAQFVSVTEHLVEGDGVWAAMKGREPNADERKELPPECQLFHVEPLSVPELKAERCLVWMRPTPAQKVL